jgi:hypothetical protein
MTIRIIETLEEFQRHFGLSKKGVLLEEDLDVVEVDTDAHGRKRRDAEVLCTLAANSRTDVLELGTSQGRAAFKLASNLAPGLRCHTVNILPEQYDSSGGNMITHLTPKEDSRNRSSNEAPSQRSKNLKNRTARIRHNRLEVC